MTEKDTLRERAGANTLAGVRLCCSLAVKATCGNFSPTESYSTAELPVLQYGSGARSLELEP